eukprot:1380562-Rhodomonas_salina.2
MRYCTAARSRASSPPSCAPKPPDHISSKNRQKHTTKTHDNVAGAVRDNVRGPSRNAPVTCGRARGWSACAAPPPRTAPPPSASLAPAAPTLHQKHVTAPTSHVTEDLIPRYRAHVPRDRALIPRYRALPHVTARPW